MTEAYQHIQVDEVPEVLVMTVKDEKIDDWDQAQAIKHELLDATDKAAATKVIVDMRNIKLLTSAGYVPFLSLRRVLQKRSGRIVMCNLTDFVNEVFSTTRMLINPSSRTATFEWAPTREDAIALLRS
jgi:anti-anti-sigma factor